MQILTDPQRTKHLIECATQGDTEAFGELYECYQLSVFRYLYYRTGDTQLAEDLTSEVFLRMIRALPGYQQKEVAFQAWLFQIAHNLLNDHYRKANVRNHVELEEDMMEEMTSTRARPVEYTLNSMTLNQAINRLSGEQRDVIVLRFISGMPIAQVAQTLNKSEDAVKGLQRRALMTLRDVLADWEVHYA